MWLSKITRIRKRVNTISAKLESCKITNVMGYVVCIVQ